MPIKTRIDVGANPEAFKQSFALFQRYQAALKRLHGTYVLQAPYVKATAEAGGELSKLVNELDRAGSSQGKFAAGAGTAAKAFHGLGTGIKATIENLSRYVLSPLQVLFPAGLAVGLFGLGAGLAGLGIAGASVYGLDRGAEEISDRRRRAMGLGVSYGSLTAYGLDFGRFGVGEETLGGVAGGIYDVTSPQYLGLLSSGSTGHGDTSEAAIALIRSIPRLLGGVPDEAVGPIARSHNLTSILDLPTIIRLRNHPEEIEAQIKRYRQDRKTLDIGKDAQEKWASFDATIKAAGQKIESALGRNLVALTPGLTKFSDDAVEFIDALIDSGAVTNALQGIEGGLRWLDGAIGSPTFKEGAKEFLSGLETLGPYIANFVDYAAKVLRITGRGAYYGAKLAGDDSYNPNLPTFLGDLAGQRQPDAGVPPPRSSSGLGGSSIRYYAGRGKERPPYGGVIDSATGKLLPPPAFKYSPWHGWNASVGDIPPELLAKVQAANPNLTPRQCVELVQSTMHVGNVHDWRRGPSEKDSPEGAALATFGFHGDSNLYAYGGSGTPGIGRDHALMLVKKYPGGSFDAVSQDIGHPPHLVHIPMTGRGGEGDASSYFAIFNKSGPAGENSKLFSPPRPMISHPHSAGKTPLRPPLDLPGAMPAQAVGSALGYTNTVGLSNMALRRHGHVLDHMNKGSPPGPIVINNQTGGAVQVTVSRHEATQ